MTNHIDTAAWREKLAALEGHTPGPWRQTQQDYVVSAGAGLALPRVAIADDAGGISDVTSNARIMAAAPDLKATLAIALDEIDRLREALSTIVYHTAFLDREWLSADLNSRLDAARAALSGEGET